MNSFTCRIVCKMEQALSKHRFLFLLTKLTLLMTVMGKILLVFNKLIHLNGVVIHRGNKNQDMQDTPNPILLHGPSLSLAAFFPQVIACAYTIGNKLWNVSHYCLYSCFSSLSSRLFRHICKCPDKFVGELGWEKYKQHKQHMLTRHFRRQQCSPLYHQCHLTSYFEPEVENYFLIDKQTIWQPFFRTELGLLYHGFFLSFIYMHVTYTALDYLIY